MKLELAGGVTVRADRDDVWAALHDPACLKLCVPGCRWLERRSDLRFDLSVLVPLGPVAVIFDGAIEMIESVFARTLVLRGCGQGGVAGLAVGRIRIDLADAPSGCRLAYALEAEPAGPVAALGSLILSGVARSQVAQFGRTFAARVGHPTLAARGADQVPDAKMRH